MKTIVVGAIVGAIVFFSLRSLVKSFNGEGGCDCGEEKEGNCSIKKNCPMSKKDKK